MTEGSGILILESLTSALNRKAKIYSEIIGFGQSGGFNLKTMGPSKNTLLNSIKSALTDADITVDKVSDILAFKSGIRSLDEIEVNSIKEIFNSETRITDDKIGMSHMMGASGAIDAITMSLAINKQELPFNKTYDNPDINIGITNSIDISGQSGSLIFSKPIIN